MARKKSVPARSYGQLVASARKIDLSDAKERAAHRKRGRDWQAQAWGAYEQIGEVWFAMNYIAHALSRVRLHVAIQANSAEAPQALDPTLLPGDDDFDPRALPASEILDRIASVHGGQAQVMSDLALNLNCPGECYLVARRIETQPATETEPALMEEDWSVFSTDQLKAGEGQSWAIADDENDRTGTETLPEDALVIRFWRRHPRYRNLADSPMRAVLPICDELLILSRQVRGAARSSLNAGLLTVPEELSFGPDDTTEGTGDGAERGDPFTEDLMAGMVTPIEDESSASSVVPTVIRGPAEYLEQIRHIPLTREIDAQAHDWRDELLRRLANGLDLPAEILLGVGSGSVNHWTAWQIDDQVWRIHLEPIALMIASALTSVYFRPALREAGIDGDDLLVWYDATDLVSKPNEAENAEKAHEALAISDARYRQALGFGEDDAPDDEEKAARIEQSRAKQPPSPFGPPPPEEEPHMPGPPPVPPDESAGLRASLALRATAEMEPTAIGFQLTRWNRELRMHLQLAGEGLLFRALERAGAKMRRTLANGAAKDSLVDVAQHEVVATLGRTIVADAGFDDNDLLAGAFLPLSDRFHGAVARVQNRVASLARRFGADPVEVEQITQQQAHDRDAGWTVLAAGLSALAGARLFDPTPAAPPIGEFDPHLSIPAGIVRSSLSVAGGAQGTIDTERVGNVALPRLAFLSAGETTPAGGVADGVTALDLFRAAGIVQRGYIWEVGDPQRPFEEHQNLADVEFSSWSDPVLTNDLDYPEGPFFRPGDHLGCQCDFTVLLGSTEED